MPDDIPQPSGWRPAPLDIVEPVGVRLQLPEVGVAPRDEPVVDARELAVGPVQPGRRDPRVRGRLGIEDPAECVRDQLPARGPLGPGLIRTRVLGPPEEDVVVRDGEVAYDVALVILVGPGNVPVEPCRTSLVEVCN